MTTLDEICIISDRHTGIMSAIDAILATDDEDDDSSRPPNLYHRFCIRHVASNFNERYHDKQLKNMIKKAGGVNQLRKFPFFAKIDSPPQKPDDMLFIATVLKPSKVRCTSLQAHEI